MKIALTGMRAITAKKTGIEYVIATGFTASGDTIKAFLEKDQAEALHVLAPTKDELAHVFSMLPLINVEFNEQGRVDSVSSE